jgi:hypothetical protein
MQLIVKDGDRIFVVAYGIFPDLAVADGASKDKLDQFLASSASHREAQRPSAA